MASLRNTGDLAFNICLGVEICQQDTACFSGNINSHFFNVTAILNLLSDTSKQVLYVSVFHNLYSV
jgi:hypothetical protein